MQPLQWCGLGRCGRMPLFAAITLLQMDLRKIHSGMNNRTHGLFFVVLGGARNPHVFQKRAAFFGLRCVYVVHGVVRASWTPQTEGLFLKPDLAPPAPLTQPRSFVQTASYI